MWKCYGGLVGQRISLRGNWALILVAPLIWAMTQWKRRLTASMERADRVATKATLPLKLRRSSVSSRHPSAW